MLLGTAGALPAAAHHPSVTEFQTGLSPNAGPWDLVDGGDGKLWFTEDALFAFGPLNPGDGLIGEVTGKLLYGNPKGITRGPDGNLWIAETADNRRRRAGQPRRQRHGVRHRRRRAGPTTSPAGRTATCGSPRRDRRPSAASPPTERSPSSPPASTERRRCHRGRPRRQPLVHGVRRPGPDRPDHARWHHHREQHRPAAEHGADRHRRRPGREHVVHARRRPRRRSAASRPRACSRSSRGEGEDAQGDDDDRAPRTG